MNEHHQAALDNLRKLLVGGTIESVDAPDADKDECLAKFTVRWPGDQLRQFHLHATDLGYWTSGEKEVKVDGPSLYTDLLQVFAEMEDHLLRLSEYTEDVFTPVEDVLHRRMGFRCARTGTEWWFTLKTIKRSPWRHHFLSVESRERFAKDFGLYGAVPKPIGQPASDVLL